MVSHSLFRPEECVRIQLSKNQKSECCLWIVIRRNFARDSTWPSSNTCWWKRPFWGSQCVWELSAVKKLPSCSRWIDRFRKQCLTFWWNRRTSSCAIVKRYKSADSINYMPINALLYLKNTSNINKYLLKLKRKIVNWSFWRYARLIIKLKIYVRKEDYGKDMSKDKENLCQHFFIYIFIMFWLITFSPKLILHIL